jgi:dolichol-phosphate mannosyltransferase
VPGETAHSTVLTLPDRCAPSFWRRQQNISHPTGFTEYCGRSRLREIILVDTSVRAPLASSVSPGSQDSLINTPIGLLRIPRASFSGAHPIDLSLVVPTYNEADNIRPFLRALKETLEPLLGNRYELLVVDDDSPDRTWEIAAGLTASIPQLRVMRRIGEPELSSAVIRGWQAARGWILGTVNADFQHPPSLLGEMLAKIQHSDLVIASRFARSAGVGGWPIGRRLIAIVARQLGRCVVPDVFRRVSDPLSGYYLIRRRAVEDAEFHPTGFKSLIEVLARVDVEKIEECGYRMRRRERGKSKLGLRDCSRFFVHLQRLRKAVR